MSDLDPTASPASSALSIVARDLGVGFASGKEAFRGLSLDVPAGQFVALVGPSGCGKTTLLRTLGGLIPGFDGSLSYYQNGQPAQLHPQDLGVCFQEPRLLPWRSALDNVALPLELASVEPDTRRSLAAVWLARVGLEHAATLRPHELSGGMRMRVAVARALIRSPRLLLLDEPFGALDEIGRAQLDDLLYKLWQDAKMTVVLVTHSLAQAVYLAQEVCIMSQSPGTIVHRAHPCFEARGRDIRGTTAFATQVAQLHEQLRLSMQAGAGVRV